MKSQLLDLDCGPCVEDEFLRHGTSGSGDGSRGLEDDKLNEKPTTSKHNVRNIHAGFPNLPFVFFFAPNFRHGAISLRVGRELDFSH